MRWRLSGKNRRSARSTDKPGLCTQTRVGFIETGLARGSDPRGSWEAFRRKSLSLVDEGYSHVVLTDISAFYEHIDIDTLISDLGTLDCPKDAVTQLRVLLEKRAQIDARGIPQGYSASDVLSKVYLHVVDVRLRQDGYVHCRYSDDIRVFCRSRAQARRSLLELGRILRRRGLSLQSAKTDIVYPLRRCRVPNWPKNRIARTCARAGRW